jgi:hypothetical protein
VLLLKGLNLLAEAEKSYIKRRRPEESCRREGGRGGESTGRAQCSLLQEVGWRQQRSRDDDEIKGGKGATIVAPYRSFPMG